MKIGIIGFAGAGKKTIFKLLTAERVPEGPVVQATAGLSQLKDVRFDKLAALFNPKKKTPATVEFILFPDLAREPERNRQIYNALERVEGICCVVGAFGEQPNPADDVGKIKEELARYPVLSQKGMVIVVNVGEKNKDRDYEKEILSKFPGQKLPIIQIPAKIEADILELESAEEQKTFMGEFGIKELRSEKLTELCVRTAGFISFFTVVKNELRQWLLKNGSTVLEAAGTIHTDLARGFIRAEVIKYEDLMNLGSEEAVKKAGKCNIKNRDYLVQDGDIINIRFSV